MEAKLHLPPHFLLQHWDCTFPSLVPAHTWHRLLRGHWPRPHVPPGFGDSRQRGQGGPNTPYSHCPQGTSASGKGYFGRHAFPVLPNLIRYSIIFLTQLPGRGDTGEVEVTWWLTSSQDSQIPRYIGKDPAETQLKGLARSHIKVTRKTPGAPTRGWGWPWTCQPRARQCPHPKARRRGIPAGTGMGWGWACRAASGLVTSPGGQPPI